MEVIRKKHQASIKISKKSSLRHALCAKRKIFAFSDIVKFAAITFDMSSEAITIAQTLEILEEEVNKHFKKKKKCRDSRVKLCPFGSYYLELHNVDSDIDVLVCFPQLALQKSIEHRESMDEISACLWNVEGVSFLRTVYDSLFPLVKFHFRGYQFDFIFAIFPIEKIDLGIDVYTMKKKHEYRLDSISYLSIVGCKDWFYLKRIMDGPGFKIPMETVKKFNDYIIQWAKNRNIYGGVWGYFPGFSLRILIFYILKKYRETILDFEGLVEIFFTEFKWWGWKNEAVSLFFNYRKNINLEERYRSNPLSSNRYKDNPYMMYIIAPTNKQTMRNMTRSTFMLIKSEITRGLKILDEGKVNGMGKLSIEERRKRIEIVAEKNTRFFKGKKMIILKVEISAKTNRELVDWKGFIQSRLTQLVDFLEELTEDLSVLTYPTAFVLKKKEGEEGEEEEEEEEREGEGEEKKHDKYVYFLVCRISGPEEGEPNISFQEKIKEFKDSVIQWEFYKKGMKISVKKAKKSDVKKYRKYVN